GDPVAKVAIGGLAGFDYDFLSAALAAGAAHGADAIGVHPYRQEGGETVGYDLLRLRNFVAGQASPAPLIWSTEWGYSSTWEGDGHGAAERARQAQLVAREALSGWAAGLPLIVIYNLRDDGNDAANAEHNFGLIQADYAEKPALVAVRTLSRLARGRAFAGLLDTGFSMLHAMKYEGANDTVVALWSEYVGRPFTMELPSNARAVSFLGQPWTLATSANGQELTLQESDGPVYVTVPHAETSSGGGSAGGASMAGAASSDPSAGGNAGNPEAQVPHAGGSTSAAGGGMQQGFAGDGATVTAANDASPSSGCACSLGSAESFQRSSARLVATVSLASLIWNRRRRGMRIRSGLGALKK
ncbi:MAG TPA: hypothetical protein VHM25_17070, partial [Polyangiaceae bacterium]|nr:hypothetical protein [Polyangiaceae bacterium]